MKIGLLGCHGFIGSHILKRLCDMGEDVVGISRQTVVPPWRREIIPSAFETVGGNLLDVSVIEENLCDVDIVIFAAGNPAPASTSFDLLFGEELRIVLGILEFLANNNPAVKFIFISSGGTVYGPRPHGVFCHEDEPLHPVSLYGVMKVACEKAIGAYSRQYGLKTTILRLANPYGIGQNPNANQGLIPVVLKKLLSDEVITLWGSDRIYRDYVSIEDFCDLLEVIIVNGIVGDIYNVGSGKGTSTKEIIDLAATITGCKPRVKLCEPRKQDLLWNALAIDKVGKECNWYPKVAMESGIQEMSEWIQKFSKKTTS